MVDQTKPASDVKANEQNQPPSEGLKTVGVLFVHGIGLQRRGDALSLAGTALHEWMKRWMRQQVLLLDTNLAQPSADEPAHSRLVLREDPGASERILLLAESFWAETFHPPTYREFVSWALRGFPLTIVLHVVATFRRNERIMRAAVLAIDKRVLTTDAREKLEAELGLDQGAIPNEPRALRLFLSGCASSAANRWLITPFLLVSLLVVSTIVQVLLLAVVFIGFLPVGFLRDFAGWTQRTVAAVLGDSYQFVASPISLSAAVTQVKKDFQWLSERCDRVVMIAHSQGAAIAHRAIEEWTWEGQVPQKLGLLITYGSGLQKLFALKQLLSREPSPKDAFYSTAGWVGSALGSISILISSLWIVGAMPWWVAVPSISAGFVLLMVAYLWFVQAFKEADPPVLAGVAWENLYATNDPVCNGPTEVNPPGFTSTELASTDAIQGGCGSTDWMHSKLLQRQVVNLHSTIADHTTYWSAKDDFVSRVARALLRVSNTPFPGVDAELIDLGVGRRRWRVGFRARCRHIAAIAALCIALWPRDAIENLGRSVGGFLSEALAFLPKWLVPDWTQGVAAYALTLGVGSLLLGIAVMYSIAVAGWNMWDRRELEQFFGRREFRAPRIGLGLFALGWFGVLAITPVMTALFNGWVALKPTLWTLLPLLVISCWIVLRSGKGPNLFSTLIPWLLEQGERLLDQEPVTHPADLLRAKRYFSWAADMLRSQGDSADRVRALLGNARALEHEERSNADTVRSAEQPRWHGVSMSLTSNLLTLIYGETLALLERMGKDTSLVKQRLKELSERAAEATVDT